MKVTPSMLLGSTALWDAAGRMCASGCWSGLSASGSGRRITPALPLATVSVGSGCSPGVKPIQHYKYDATRRCCSTASTTAWYGAVVVPLEKLPGVFPSAGSAVIM